MAYDEYDDDDPRTAEEMLESVRRALTDLDERVKKLNDDLEDANAGLRLEMAQNRREITDMRSAMVRLQGRFDNQMTALILANIASGVGVAALVLGASRALG